MPGCLQAGLCAHVDTPAHPLAATMQPARPGMRAHAPMRKVTQPPRASLALLAVLGPEAHGVEPAGATGDGGSARGKL